MPAPIVLDARRPRRADLAKIIERQQRLVQVAELRRRFVALLDVPTGLPTARITDWRAVFDSSFAAAYHPWLGVPQPAPRTAAAVTVPPSAFAAGIIADAGARLGLAAGPGQRARARRGRPPRASVTRRAARPSCTCSAINVFGAERDGFRLTAARTLSADPDYRQLSVRRLMTMLALDPASGRRSGCVRAEHRRAPCPADQRAHPAAAGPAPPRRVQRARPRRSRSSSAATTRTNPPESQALGRLVAEIGVAPAAPLEYLVLRIASDGDGGLLVDEQARTVGDRDW